MPTTNTEPTISIRREPDGNSTRVDLMLDEKSLSRLWLVPFTIHIGKALVRMDGVGGVGTDEAHRSRGYSRRVIEAAVEHMIQGDAAISMLYGIRDFYPKFGYATAGPDFIAVLTDLERDSALPEGWSVRSFAQGDLQTVKSLYARNTERATGAAVRPDHHRTWKRLSDTTTAPEKDACRVAVGPDGLVHGYVWRARWCWYVNDTLEHNFNDALVLGEVMADGHHSADAVLAACRQWAREEPAEKKVKQVVLSFPPEGPISSAAMRQDARLLGNFSACGGSMARVLNVGRLLESLRPELAARLRSARSDLSGSLLLRTEIGDATLIFGPDGVSVADTASGAEFTASLPQSELARLALGAFPPDDILSRLPEPPADDVAKLLQTLFPLRYSHMHLPDRY